MNFLFQETKLDKLIVVTRDEFIDERGQFSRIFCDKEFSSFGLKGPIRQINHSFTEKTGTVRGMHFQSNPFEEVKVVTCLHGEVFDVVVDFRKNSKTFLQWHGEVLNEDNRKLLLIPKGFAHGFQTLRDNTELIYLHSEPYSKEYEGDLNPFDKKIDIKWPLEITNISPKALTHPYLD